MQPQDPQQPLLPPVPPAPPEAPLPPVGPLPSPTHKKDTVLAGPDPKKNPFSEHIARPKEVPLAKPEYVHPDQAVPSVPDPSVATQQAYEFIIQSPKEAKKPSRLTNSLPKRIAVMAGGLLLLIIVFSVVKGMFTTGPNLTGVVATVQRQQAILHVLDGALQQTSLSTTNKNFALTATLALGTSQNQLITYMQGTGKKLDPQTLGLKISASTDTELTASAANNAYNQTFKQIMQTQLTGYSDGLKQAYIQDTGRNGRKLLNDDYNQAQLLLQQLQLPGN